MRWMRRKERESDLDRELQRHLELEAAEQREAGVGAGEAEWAARRALGNTALLKEDVRQVWGWTAFERLAQDIRYGWRGLRRSPGFTLFAVAALALGLGANAAIFSVVDAVLLRPLPFRDAGNLVEVWEEASHMGFPLDTPAPANFVDWKRRNHVFSDMAALTGDLYALTGAGRPEQVTGSPVTANLFPLLGVAPILGRNFTTAEAREGGPRVVLIGYQLWRDRFGSNPDVVGRRIWLNAEKYEVIGVMPRGVAFPEETQIWLPLALGPRDWAARDSHYLRVFARLKPGVTIAQARADMNTLAANLARQYPETNTNVGAAVVSLRDQMVGSMKLALWVVAAGVGCVLLVTCANLAGLMLARAAGREREFAVRAALGAGRGRLLRQMATESALLAAIGGAAGVGLAVWTVPLLRRMVPAALATWSQPKVDAALAGFVLLAAAVSATLFGVLPALPASGGDPAAALQRGGRAAIGGGTRLRRMLTVAEVALSLVLVVGAGLMARTVWELSHVPLGFRPDGVITLRTALPVSAGSRYQSFASRSAFYLRVLERVRAIPGVVSAGYTTFLPLTNAGGTSEFWIEGAPPPAPGEIRDANHRSISADYLQTMGVRLRAGRFFRDSDGPAAPPVAIVNAAMARRYWPGRDPLGHRLRLGEAEAPWITIVGVVDDIRQMGLDVGGRAEMYFPCTQPAATYGFFTPRDLAVRVTGEPARYARAMERAVWDVDRDQPIANVMPMAQLVAAKLAWRETAMKMTGAFALLALLVAALGLYGLLAYTVARRRREIGVRMAMGAHPRQVLRAVLGEGLRLVLFGVALGAAASWAVMRALGNLLYGVAPDDPWVLAGAAGVLIAVGVVASYAPARRAAAIDPVVSLRSE